MEETDRNRPSHYHDAPFDVATVQEYVVNNIANAGCVTKSFWTGMALKHILRAGKKDDIDIELVKARNYLNRAIEGEWLRD